MSTQKKQSFAGRYRALVIAISLFVVLDVGVVGYSLFTSFQVSRDTLKLNAERRLNVLAVALPAGLLSMQNDQLQGVNTDPDTQKKFADDIVEFNSIVSALLDGGTITDSAGKKVHIAALTLPADREAIEAFQGPWDFFTSLSETLNTNGTITPEDLAGTVPYFQANRSEFSEITEKLSENVEVESAQAVNRMQLVQTVGLVLTILNFVYTIFVALRQLMLSDRKILEAQKETQDILANVKEGLFLLDTSLKVGAQTSTSLPAILQQPVQEGTAFLEVLGAMVPADTLRDAKSYIELLFSGRVKEGLMQSLNPLSEVAVEVLSSSNVRSTRTLSFQFNRVLVNGAVTHLLVTVQDATQKAKLAADLELAKTRARAELEVYLQLMTKDRGSLLPFLTRSRIALEGINKRLRTASGPGFENNESVVNFAMRTAHSIKGEASALGLELFESMAHKFEEELVRLRDSGAIRGDDMLNIALSIDQFFERLSLIENILTRIDGALPASSDAKDVLAEFVSPIQDLVQRIASKQNKTVEFTSELGAIETLPVQRRAELRNIAIQLVRNAIVHGIEAPAERLESGKPQAGTLRLSCTQTADGGIDFAVRDDGRGLQPQRIRETLLRSGRYSADEVSALSERDLVAKIFEPGISTSEEVDVDSGRGVGLDVVRNEIGKIGGRLAVSSRPNQFTAFTIRLGKTA